MKGGKDYLVSLTKLKIWKSRLLAISSWLPVHGIFFGFWTWVAHNDWYKMRNVCSNSSVCLVFRVYQNDKATDLGILIRNFTKRRNRTWAETEPEKYHSKTNVSFQKFSTKRSKRDQTRNSKRIWSNVTLSKWQYVLLKTCHPIRFPTAAFENHWPLVWCRGPITRLNLGCKANFNGAKWF